MDKKSILARIDEMIASMHSNINELEEMKKVISSEESVNESPVVTGEVPVVNPKTGEILPSDSYESSDAVPTVDNVEDDSPTEEEVAEAKADSLLGWKILAKLPDFYKGKVRRIELQKPYFDNGQDKLFIDKYHIKVRAYDINNKLLGETKKPFNMLSEFHIELIQRGINKHRISSDPHKNWMPYEITLWLL